MSAFGRLFGRAPRLAPLRVVNTDAWADSAARYGITGREAEIIRLLLEGKSVKEITEALFISDHTVKNHIHNIYRKLGIRNRVQLVQCFRASLENGGTAPPGPARKAFFRRRVAVPFALGLVVLSVGLIAWRPWGRRPKPLASPPPPVLAVLDFENVSGDPDLEKWETGLPLLLTTDLLQSKIVRTLGDDAVFGALKKHALTPGRRYSRLELRRLAEDLKADYLVTGGLIKAGDRIVVTVFLQEALTGAPVRIEKIEVSDEQGLMRGADDLARLVKSELRRQVAQSPADIDLDVEVLTTASSLAYKYYSEGRRYHRTGDYEQSLSMLRSAVEIDPEFAMAYRAMAVDARNLGYFQREAEYMRKAFELSGRLPENSRERRLIRADYYTLSEATLGQAAEEFRKVLDDHPYDLVANNNLAILSHQLEDFEAALKHADILVRQGTADPFPHYTKAVALWALGRLDEALRALAAYHESYPANRLIYQVLAAVLIEAGDFTGAGAALEKARSFFPDPSWAYWQGAVDFHTQGAAAAREEFGRLFLMDEVPWRLRGYLRLALVALAGGRFADAEKECRHGAELAETVGELEWASDFRNILGQTLLEEGSFEAAIAEDRKAVEKARAAASGDRVRAALHSLSVACVRAGDLAAAAAAERDYRASAAESPTKRAARNLDLFIGELELERGRPPEAIKALESAAAKLPAGSGPGSYKALINSLLGRARERTADLSGAAAAYQAVIEGIGDRLELGEYLPLAVLGRARVKDKLGFSQQAIEGYRSFLTMWQDADPGRPEVAEARARLEGLSRSR